MGRYQWELFVLCGFGWMADKYVSLPQKRVPILTSYLACGFKVLP